MNLVHKSIGQGSIQLLIEAFRPVSNGDRFLFASVVSEIKDDRHSTAGTQEIHRLPKGRKRRGRLGGRRLVSPWKISEVKHDGCDPPVLVVRYSLSHRLVTGSKQREIALHPGIGRPAPRFVEGRPLNVEPVHAASAPYRLRQERRIVPIANGCIHNRIAFVHRPAGEGMGGIENRCDGVVRCRVVSFHVCDETGISKSSTLTPLLPSR